MKKIKKKFLTYLITVCMVMGLAMPGNIVQAASSSDRYTDTYDYKITTVLKNYQYFVNGDVTLGNAGHTIGAVVVGGKLDVPNSVSEGGIAPSYVNDITQITSYGANPITPPSSVPLSKTIYYGVNTCNATNPPTDGITYCENPDYIDVSAAFDSIKDESIGLSQLTATVTANNYFTGVNDKGIEIDLTGTSGTVVCNITYDDYVASIDTQYGSTGGSGVVNIKVDNIDWFRTNTCLINITGVNGNALLFDGNTSRININGQGLASAFDNYANDYSYKQGNQYNFAGFNLVWNLPDASGDITLNSMAGHVVAPKATVKPMYDYEGGLIANKIDGNAEGHFFPMSSTLPSVDGTGSGDGSGTGSGDGSGTGSGDGSGTGSGDGSGTGSGDGNGTGSGDGSGTGSGDGSGTDSGDGNGTDSEDGSGTGSGDGNGTGSEDGTDKPGDTGSSEEPEVAGSLIVTVFDEKTKGEVPGATIKVTDPSGNSKEYITNADGKVIINGVPAGDYKIETIKVPEGYTVTIGRVETATVAPGETASHDVFINTASKTDTTTSTNTTNTTTTDTTDDHVKTGDEANLKLPSVLMLISALGIVYVLYSKKREN